MVGGRGEAVNSEVGLEDLSVGCTYLLYSSLKEELADKRKCVMFFGLQVDRNNLTQAVSGTFLKDLKLNTNGAAHHPPIYHQSLIVLGQIIIGAT